MIVTITQFRTLAADADGTRMPLPGARGVCQARTTDGAFAALATSTRFVRVATDTAIRMDIAGGATDTSDELFMPGVEYISVRGGETLSIAEA